jgi:hypothetical protein
MNIDEFVHKYDIDTYIERGAKIFVMFLVGLVMLPVGTIILAFGIVLVPLFILIGWLASKSKYIEEITG